MRDYVAYRTKDGHTVPISRIPLYDLVFLVDYVAAGSGESRYNPGVTREAYLERLRLELFIREMGLND